MALAGRVGGRVSGGFPASAQEIDALRQAVEGVCPIYNLLKDRQTITGRIVRARYEPSAKSN